LSHNDAMKDDETTPLHSTLAVAKQLLGAAGGVSR
jgi:hypothetical protein